MRFSASTALLAVIVLLCVAQASAYNVVYSIKTNGGTLGLPDTSGCQSDDGALHMAMPPTAYGQELAVSAVSSGGVSGDVPLGGEARTAQCGDLNCPWVWNDGLFYRNPHVFLLGVVRETSGGARLPMQRHVEASNGTDNVYCNFDACINPATGVYPKYDPEQTYWGLRKVVMGTDGAWKNVAYSTTFSTWLCEAYEFQVDSQVNDSARFGLAMFPPSRGGVAYPPIDPSTYEYCPNAPNKRIKVKSERWMYPNCNPGFPWWAGLIIAIVCFIILVALILIIWCCCLRRRDRKLEEVNDHKNRTQKDNTTNVPTQSQLGMSRASTLEAGYEDEDEYSNEDEFSGQGGGREY